MNDDNRGRLDEAPDDPATLESCIAALNGSIAQRPSGMVDVMHYGFALRYNGFRGQCDDADTWRTLEESAGNLNETLLTNVAALIEARPWQAGHCGTISLATHIWPRLSPLAQGNFLAGLSCEMQVMEPRNAGKSGGECDATALAQGYLPGVALDAPAAAEIGANFIRCGQNDMLLTLLQRHDLPNSPVARYRGCPNQEGFESQLSKHSTRLLDVLLEASVRCGRADAVRLLLDRGANPDIPCWNLERSFSDWFCALSFAIHDLWETSRAEQTWQIIESLLRAGANAQGIEWEGRNHPLMLAMRGGHWMLVDRLLELGARFEGGQPYGPDDCSFEGRRLIPAGHALVGYRQADLDWVQREIAPLVPLVDVWQVPLYHQGNGQGGTVSTFLNCVLSDQCLPLLQKYEALGLPTTLTPTLVLDILQGGCQLALCHLLRDNPNLPRVLALMQERDPEFGVSGRQVWLGEPASDGSNAAERFQPHGQQPLALPDGSRVYAYLDCVAPPAHELGPLTEGSYWLENIETTRRRIGDRIVIGDVVRTWRMRKLPTYPIDALTVIPLVKVKDGRVFFLGISLNGATFGQNGPPEWKSRIWEWCTGPAKESILAAFHQRIADQRAATPVLPAPVLADDDLKPYPREFWPYLRRLPDTSIGATEDSCAGYPAMRERYAAWAKANKPDESFRPDPRLLTWPGWKDVPLELRPFFCYDDLFEKPTVTYHSRNDYEKEMIHKAVAWWNAGFIKALNDAGM